MYLHLFCRSACLLEYAMPHEADSPGAHDEDQHDETDDLMRRSKVFILDTGK